MFVTFQRSVDVTWMHLVQFAPGVVFGLVAAYFKDGYLLFPERTLRVRIEEVSVQCFQRATPRIEDDEGKDWLYRVGAAVEVVQVILIICCYIVSSVKLLKKKETAGKKKQVSTGWNTN